MRCKACDEIIDDHFLLIDDEFCEKCYSTIPGNDIKPPLPFRIYANRGEKK